MDNRGKKSRLSFLSSNLTAIISVALVLLLLGMVAFLTVIANNMTEKVKENIGFDVVLTEDVNEVQVNALKQMWSNAPYVASVKYISRDNALHEWEDETGENLMEVLGENPLSAEFEVHVKAKYASVDSLNRIEYRVKQMQGVDEVQMHKDMVENINSNIHKIQLILLIVSVILLIISIALINNTVRLSVYSRRFLIHTMKLVGAKPSFIRKPFIVSNIINGVIAAVVADVILVAGVWYLLTSDIGSGLKECINVNEAVAVGVILIIIGAAMCAIAAFLATTRFIKLDYDDLYTK